MKETKCQYHNCDGDATKSMMYAQSVNRQGHTVPVGKESLIKVCVGHYYYYQTAMYGCE
jgi:hypothetical protein